MTIEQEVKGHKAAIEQEKSEFASTSEREQARPMVKVAIDIVKANIFAVCNYGGCSHCVFRTFFLD